MKTEQINISICGHAKHGKSTLAGRIIRDMGGISEGDLKKLQRELDRKKQKDPKKFKDYNVFNYLFLKHRSMTYNSKEELDDQSRTVFPERANIHVGGNIVTFVDTPGFSRYIDNIVYGIYLADLGAVAIEASAGIDDGTMEVVRILNSFKIKVFAFFVTKMHLVKYSKTRYDEIKKIFRRQFGL